MDVERMLEAVVSEAGTPAQRVEGMERLVQYVGLSANKSRRWEVLDTIVDPLMELAETCVQRDVVSRANRLLDTIEAMEQARQVEAVAYLVG